MGILANLTWILVALSILGNIFVIYDRKLLGYMTWFVANIGWIAYNVYIGEFSQMSLFAVYTFLSILGISVEYRKKNEPAATVKDRTESNV